MRINHKRRERHKRCLIALLSQSEDGIAGIIEFGQPDSY